MNNTGLFLATQTARAHAGTLRTFVLFTSGNRRFFRGGRGCWPPAGGQQPLPPPHAHLLSAQMRGARPVANGSGQQTRANPLGQAGDPHRVVL